MASNNRNFTDDLGFGLDLWYSKTPFSQKDEYTSASQKVIAHGLQGTTPPEKAFVKTFFRIGGQNATGVQGESIFVKSSLNENSDDYVNDTSLTSIITHLQKWRATYVDYSDFAYLKHLGVYPTNRLMICRRFPAPVGNNLYAVDADPLATLISWVPDNTDFFSVTYKEEWENGPTSLLDVLNDIGEDVGLKDESGKGFLGTLIEKKVAGKLLPGLAERLQILLAKQLGIAGDYDSYNPPIANPNFINVSKKRKTLNKHKDGGDSGLTSDFSITFNAEYEMKFINGVDPSLVYLDIIHKALIFGTSKSVFMFNDTFGGEVGDFTSQLMKGAVGPLLVSIGNLIKNLGNALIDLLSDLASRAGEIAAEFAGNVATGSFEIPVVKELISYLLSRHRTKLLAALQAMTGAPSGYWHVTIGNPKKPVFSSGDLYMAESMTLKLGQKLGYNDLPSTISINFALKPMRNLGGQEIFDRLNSGTGRTYHQFKVSWVEERFDPTQVTGGADYTVTTPNTPTNTDRYEAFKKKIKSELDKPGFGKENPSGNPPKVE